MANFQFSLKGLLILLIAAGMIATMFAISRENRVLHQKMESFRGQLGALDITNPRSVYVRRLLCKNPYELRFRIYIPNEEGLCIQIETEDLPETGLPKPKKRNCNFASQGEQTIELLIHIDGAEKSRIYCATNSGLSHEQVNESAARSLGVSLSQSDNADYSVHEIEWAKVDGYLLFSMRCGDENLKQLPGLMIWLKK